MIASGATSSFARHRSEFTFFRFGLKYCNRFAAPNIRHSPSLPLTAYRHWPLVMTRGHPKGFVARYHTSGHVECIEIFTQVRPHQGRYCFGAGGTQGNQRSISHRSEDRQGHGPRIARDWTLIAEDVRLVIEIDVEQHRTLTQTWRAASVRDYCSGKSTHLCSDVDILPLSGKIAVAASRSSSSF